MGKFSPLFPITAILFKEGKHKPAADRYCEERRVTPKVHRVLETNFTREKGKSLLPITKIIIIIIINQIRIHLYLCNIVVRT